MWRSGFKAAMMLQGLEKNVSGDFCFAFFYCFFQRFA